MREVEGEEKLCERNKVARQTGLIRTITAIVSQVVAGGEGPAGIWVSG